MVSSMKQCTCTEFSSVLFIKKNFSYSLKVLLLSSMLYKGKQTNQRTDLKTGFNIFQRVCIWNYVMNSYGINTFMGYYFTPPRLHPDPT